MLQYPECKRYTVVFTSSSDEYNLAKHGQFCPLIEEILPTSLRMRIRTNNRPVGGTLISKTKSEDRSSPQALCQASFLWQNKYSA
jgi:hypothetical protein